MPAASLDDERPTQRTQPEPDEEPQLGLKVARRVARIFNMDVAHREMRNALGLRAESKASTHELLNAFLKGGELEMSAHIRRFEKVDERLRSKRSS